ncbi:MAG: cbb3-type cytochrome oxidase assembly protein CcoS [Prolixibacteraceae bacterium]|nr:cbb3-type cytochrome oxidase assembly protein CcoS [Prolixibacteraceae bacterium]
MSVVFILVFVAILMAGGFLVAFVWAVRSGQYEDTYTPSVRILFDDMVKKKEPEDRSQKNEKGSGETEKEESRGLQSQLTENPQPVTRKIKQN